MRQCLPVVAELVDENPYDEGEAPAVVEDVDEAVVEDVQERVQVDRICDVFVDGDAVTPVNEEQGAVVSRQGGDVN